MSGRLIKTLIGHSDDVYCLAELSKSRLASGSEDSTIKVWNFDDGSCIRTIESTDGYVLSVLALKDGMLASGTRYGKIMIWDPNNGRLGT